MNTRLLITRGRQFHTLEGPGRRRTDEAVEDAHDHTQPGWPDLPAVPELQGRRWLTYIQHLYPQDWFDGGGPICTVRTGIEKRHRPGAAPGGGYDLAVQPPRRKDPVTAIPDVLPLEFDSAEAT
ncbi:DUF6349 family protein [Streptomyces sp. NPDC057654]|uniref:DUF6349 family protein n=1 Tax=Streptomyces sp. NPDC057654 TaxID=3346196 RepID=UPI0036D1BA2A